MKVLGIITTVFMILYMVLNKGSSFIFILSNGFFMIGIVYFLIAALFYVRNVGFFKLISYHRYRRRYMKTNYSQKDRLNHDLSHDENMMEFHEFCEDHYKEQWSNKIFLIYGIPLLVLSYILAYFA
mgnify:CR=1 FL=1